MKKLFTYTIFLISSVCFAQQEDKVYNMHDHHPQGKVSDDEEAVHKFNIKVMPAVFASTLGLEFELPIGNGSSLGINLLGKYGRLDNPRISRPVDYFETGFRAELAYKYYFSQKGPFGFYGQAFVGYSKLLYDNGNTRPFALNLRDLDINGDPRNYSEFKLPKPYTAGLGVGYQVKIIKDRLIGNIMLGAQLGLEENQALFYSIYLNPSIGYAF